MKLGGDARAIYRKIVALIEGRLGAGKDRVKNLRLFSSKEEILSFQKWVGSFPRKSCRLPEVGISVKPDARVVYTDYKLADCKLKIEKMGFFVEESSSTGIIVGNTFVRFNEEETTLIDNFCREGNRLGVCSIICPEKVVESILKVSKELSTYSKFLKSCGIDAKAIDSTLSKAVEARKLFDRVAKAEMVEEMVIKELNELNEKIENKIADFEVTLRGKSILDLMQGDKTPLRDVESFIAEQVVESEERLRRETGVEFSGLFSYSYPVEINENVLKSIVEDVESEVRLELYRECRRVAEEILKNSGELKKEIELAKDIEFSTALRETGKAFPEVADFTAFIKGEHLFIKNPQPVTYSVGDSPVAKGRIAILTGANSGGKTSLLELLAQIQIMGQMGLPVKAEKAWIRVFDGLYFFRKKKGVAGAGAFESAVRAFVRAVVAEGTNLILIDEFEAITEPGAAVSIIAELLKIAYERGHYVVIVSHLGKELKELLPFARVDGIEAKGLDENFNLIVDRQPVFGRIGRSTPELILERMYRKARGREKEVLERLVGAVK